MCAMPADSGGALCLQDPFSQQHLNIIKYFLAEGVSRGQVCLRAFLHPDRTACMHSVP